MNRHEIVNHIIKKEKYTRYLEIGVQKGHSFKKVLCDHKDGVDPNPKKIKVKYQTTSDDFFRTISDTQQYDIIFIYGLHEKNQVLRDVDNSLKHLLEGGTIVMHDCSPPSEYMASLKRCGTVWEAVVELRQRENLDVQVVDTDYGVGIVKLGEQKVLVLEKDTKITYDFLESNRKEILNLISVKEFRDE